jgi:hypothetical protein
MQHHIFTPIRAHVDNYTIYVFGINIYICEMAISFLFQLKLNGLVKFWNLEKEMGHNLAQIS